MAQPKLDALAPYAQGRMRYQSQARSKRTLQGYERAYGNFVRWCERHNYKYEPATEATIGEFLADLGAASYAVSTIRLHMLAITVTCSLKGHPINRRHPDIRDTFQGICRVNGKEQKQARALTVDQLRQLSLVCGDKLGGLRDRALILLGFAGAFRRSELVAIDAEHLTWTNTGVTIFIPRSKQDQAGRGARLTIPFGSSIETCAVTAVQSWMLNARIAAGPIFRRVDKVGRVLAPRLNDKQVARTIIARAKEAGLAGTPDSPISSHSLRAGFVTAAYKAGLLDEEIMAHTRHRTLRKMRAYVRHEELNEVSPAGRIGL